MQTTPSEPTTRPLRESDVTYPRSQLTVGIVHLGVGGFHRAHQAMYLDRLMQQGLAHDWAICGVGVLPSDARMRDVMEAQNGLYTLTVKAADGSTDTSVIGSIVEYLLAPDDPERVIARMADPAVRIVSLTVTEGGYNIDDVTGRFLAEKPDIVHDLAHPEAPRTHFGLITAALARRRAEGTPPFIVQSCDNLPGNGHVTRDSYLEFAKLLDPELAQWIEAEVAFPNSMVDRITPATTDADRELVAERSGLADGWPVVCEPFTQWVVEDFSPRPPFEEVGAQYVEDVVPYELMKLRLLNASHQGLCYFGALAGHHFVHDAMADQRLADFLLAYMTEEGTPTVPPVPGVDLAAYRTELIERFQNPGVGDTIARLCAESSDRIPKWLVPVIKENLAADRSVALSAAIVASWATYAEKMPDAVVDRDRDRIVEIAARQEADPLAFLRQPVYFGDLADDPRFTDPYLQARRLLLSGDAMEAVAELTA